MATIPLNRSSGSGCSEVKRLRNRYQLGHPPEIQKWRVTDLGLTFVKRKLRKRNRLKLLFGCCSRQTGAESDIENVSDSEDCAFNE